MILEFALLAALIFATNLLELSDVCAADFSPGRTREIFSLIAEIWESERPAEIDITILAERLKGEDRASFVAELMSGQIRLEPEIFGRRLAELRRRRLSERIVQEARKLGECHLKTGAFDKEGFAALGDLVIRQRALGNVGPRIQPLSSIEPKEIQWLWSGRIPFGMLSLIAGVPGLGKSFLALFIAARLSRGEPLPDSAERIEADSFFLCAEDPLAHAVRPRFDASGGDPARIFVLEEKSAKFGDVLPQLQQILKERPGIRFAVLDPLNAFLKSDVDYFRDPDVRRNLLGPLSDLAEETGAAVIGVCHLRKDENASALSRVAGSVAFGAAARAVLGIGTDPEDEDRRILASIKSNYAKRPPSLGFRIGADLRVSFDDKPVDRDPESIFSRPDPEAAADHNFACKWLREALKAGPVDFRDLRTAAEEAGVLKNSLYRAQKRLGIIPIQSGFGKFRHSTWGLPK